MPGAASLSKERICAAGPMWCRARARMRGSRCKSDGLLCAWRVHTPCASSTRRPRWSAAHVCVRTHVRVHRRVRTRGAGRTTILAARRTAALQGWAQLSEATSSGPRISHRCSVLVWPQPFSKPKAHGHRSASVPQYPPHFPVPTVILTLHGAVPPSLPPLRPLPPPPFPLTSFNQRMRAAVPYLSARARSHSACALAISSTAVATRPSIAAAATPANWSARRHTPPAPPSTDAAAAASADDDDAVGAHAGSGSGKTSCSLPLAAATVTRHSAARADDDGDDDGNADDDGDDGDDDDDDGIDCSASGLRLRRRCSKGAAGTGSGACVSSVENRMILNFFSGSSRSCDCVAPHRASIQTCVAPLTLRKPAFWSTVANCREPFCKTPALLPAWPDGSSESWYGCS
eukprot:6213614-Pleurochrysis_carterae.AAC.2